MSEKPSTTLHYTHKLAHRRRENRVTTQVVAVDIGGTHARFALAQVADGRVAALGDPVTQIGRAHV